MVKNLLVGFRCRRAGWGVRETVQRGARFGAIRPKEQPVSLLELHFAECYEPFDRSLKDPGR